VVLAHAGSVGRMRSIPYQATPKACKTIVWFVQIIAC